MDQKRYTERETHTDTQTHRHTDTQTQTHRHIDTHTRTHAHTHRGVTFSFFLLLLEAQAGAGNAIKGLADC